MTWSNTGGPPEPHPPKKTITGNSKGDVLVKGTLPSSGYRRAESGPDRAARLRRIAQRSK